MKKAVDIQCPWTVHFRQWSRKAYAVFSSLNQIIRIGVLLLSYNILADMSICAMSVPDSVSPAPDTLQQVEVRAGRTTPFLSSQYQAITQVQADRIHSAPASDVNELIEHLPSVDMRQRGIHGVQADLSIRGGTAEQNLVMLNGVPLNDPQTGHHNLNLPLGMSGIEAFSLIEGPSSISLKPGAYSGALNFQSLRSPVSGCTAGIQYGQENLRRAYINGMLHTPHMYNHIHISGKAADAYRPNTDFKQYSLFYRGEARFEDHSLKLQLAYVNKAFGAHQFYSTTFPDQYEQTRTHLFSLDYQQHGKIQWQPMIYWRRNYDRFELFRESVYRPQGAYFVTSGGDTAKYVPGNYAASNYYTGHNFHRSDVAGAELNASIISRWGKTMAGMRASLYRITSNILGETIHTPIAVPYYPGAFYTKAASRELMNLSVLHDLELSKTVGIRGGMHLQQSLRGSVTPLVNAGLTYQPEKHMLIVSVRQALRNPTFTELHYTGPENIGNPDLKAEKATSYECRYQYHSGAFKWKISSFLRDARHTIDWVKALGESVYKSMNYTHIQTWGVGSQICFQTESIACIKEIQLYYNYLSKEKISHEYISAYVLDYLKHKAGARLDLTVFEHLFFRMELSFQDRNGTYTAENNREMDYAPVVLCDMRLSYTYKNASAFITCYNVCDQEYRDIGSLLQPGRWISGGIEIELFAKNKK